MSKCTCGGDLGQPASHHDISCPMAIEPDAWLVQWFRRNGETGTNVYVKEADARQAAKNLEMYSASETTAGVIPLYAAVTFRHQQETT